MGGSYYDILGPILQLSDGSYIVAGSTQSNDGDVSGNHGLFDAWVVKIDEVGNIQWQKCYGGSGNDGSGVIVRIDSNYYILGGTESSDGDVSYYHGGGDVWLICLDDTGTIVWEKTYGGSDSDYGMAMENINGNRLVMGGGTESSDGDLTGSNYHSEIDNWILEINLNGDIQFSKCYGGSYLDALESICISEDQGVILGGWSDSHDGDLSYTHGSWDYWILKIDSTGVLKWQKSLGGTNDDRCYSVIQSNNGNYWAAGYTMSDNGDVTYNHGMYNDAWLVELDSSGNLLWQSSFGGSLADIAFALIQLQDGSYVFGGTSSSTDDDVPSNNHGYADIWLAQLSEGTAIVDFKNQNTYSIYPNPASNKIYFRNENNSSGQFQIKDTYGNNLITKTFKEFENAEIDMGVYAPGIYIMIVADDISIQGKKIVLQPKP